MAYSVYNYTEKDTLGSIAKAYGISVEELCRINNIQPPYSTDILNDKNLGGRIRVPEIYNGKESFENKDRSLDVVPEVEQMSRSRSRVVSGLYDRVGFSTQYACYFAVNPGKTAQRVYYFPCFPESFSDTRGVSYSPQTPLGRSEPFEIYTNSGPRTVSVTFRMHREMLDDNNYGDKINHIDTLVYAVQSATYPLDYGEHIPPKVRLVIGKACDITGIIADSVTANWSETIIDQRYQVVELSFTVTEVTGNPPTYNMTHAIYGY